MAIASAVAVRVGRRVEVGLLLVFVLARDVRPLVVAVVGVLLLDTSATKQTQRKQIVEKPPAPRMPRRLNQFGFFADGVAIWTCFPYPHSRSASSIRTKVEKMGK